LASGVHFLILSVDPELREKLAGAIAFLEEVKARFMEIPQERFANAMRRASLLKEIDDIAGWFDHIRLMSLQRSGPPTSRDTLTALNDEAITLASIMQQAVEGAGQVTVGDERQIHAIHKDLVREIRRYDDLLSGGVPDSDVPACCVIEAQILGADPDELKRVRIYYTLDGLFRNQPPGPLGVKAFPVLGAGRSQRVPPKDYRVWVSPDGALLVEIFPADTEKKVELRLKKSNYRQ
jgi:hypothetical protein